MLITQPRTSHFDMPWSFADVLLSDNCLLSNKTVNVKVMKIIC